MNSKILYTLLLFFTVFINGQVSIEPVISKDRLSTEETFKLTFIVHIKGVIESDSPLFLPDFSKFDIVGSASNRNTVIVGDEMVDEKVYQWVLKPIKTGKIKIGSARVMVNGKNYYTEPIDIEVYSTDVPKKNDKKFINPYLNIEIQDRDVFLNEPIHGEIKIYAHSIKDLQKIKKPKLQKQANLTIEKISFKKSDIDVINSNLVSQTVANFILLPLREGKLNIKPALAKISKNTKVQSKPVFINVKPLPISSMVGDNNAVGDYFKIDILLDNKDEKPSYNQPFKVYIKLRGKGNISNVEIPTFKKRDSIEIYPPKINRKTYVKDNELIGEAIAEYIILPKKEGDVSLEIDDFVYFNPKTKKYIKLSSPSLEISIDSSDKIIDPEATFQKVNQYTNNVLSTVDNPILRTHSLMTKKKNEFPWRAIIIYGVLVLLVVCIFLIFKKWKKQMVENNAAGHFKSLGSVEESELEIKKKLEQSYTEHLNYFKTLLEKKDYDTFFKELKFFKNQILDESGYQSMEEMIKEVKGDEALAELKKIKEAIQLEEYNPVKNHNNIELIYKSIFKLFSDIRKK